MSNVIDLTNDNNDKNDTKDNHHVIDLVNDDRNDKNDDTNRKRKVDDKDTFIIVTINITNTKANVFSMRQG